MESLEKRLLSDQNVFLAVYLANSWIQEKALLSDIDQECLRKLKDVFDQDNISGVIHDVQKRLQEILNDVDSFFHINVFFKPKGSKDGKTVFRPIHTASLIDQIAMVAMLQILVYETNAEGKLIPSELSRMLPSNFYGNRIAYDGEHLFKPWKEQYHQYTADANDRLIQFAQTGIYKYEITLDLQNFFPSIDPKILFQFIQKKFPLKWSPEDTATARTILRKLLLFELEPLTCDEQRWYYGEESGRQLKDQQLFAKGLPQGLPHTYFMANMFMLLIQKKYEQEFPGEMFFYVDDSVIFTNGNQEGRLDETSFGEAISRLNKEIHDEEERLRITAEDEFILPGEYPYQTQEFGVTIHQAGNKSIFSDIGKENENAGELYLRGLSRETSNTAFDISTMFSDEDVQILYNRTKTISDTIGKALDCLSEIEHCEEEQEEKLQIQKKKLLRYKKFFAYRETILHYLNSGDWQKLLEEILDIIEVRDNSSKLEKFLEGLNDDILAATIQFLIERIPDDASRAKLVQAVERLCDALYGASLSHAYLLKTCKYAEKLSCEDKSTYRALKKKMCQHYCRIRQQLADCKRARFEELLHNSSDQLFDTFEYQNLKQWSGYIRCNSQELERRILNAAFSYLLDYEIDDSFIFAKKSRNPILYSELRILSALRNKDFCYVTFQKDWLQFTSDAYECIADYSLLQVMEIFRTFVRNAKRIDQLICVHKYCCDTWKNGSKHLHFYTLHNQEHAVTLIKLAVRWMHAISLFRFKQTDYFILFAACYLHDISMVTLPDYSKFYDAKNVQANGILTKVEKVFDHGTTIESQKALLEAYQSIDTYFEHNVRNNHAQDSAKEIRKFPELDFIDTSTREFIARISEAHGDDILDVYCARAKGKTELVNEKQLKILLRLSDLLDMSRYRVSDVILKHNLSRLSKESRFHWISHLITDGCDISATYYPTESINSAKCTEWTLRNGCITEKIILTVDVLMSQTTPINREKKCVDVSESNLYSESDGHAAIKLNCKKNKICPNQQCNFLCKWFTLKNKYLLNELAQLKKYLDDLPERFFRTEIEIQVRVIADRDIPNDIFDYLREYVNEK